VGNDDPLSLRHAFPWGRLASLKSQVWIGRTGTARRLFARYIFRDAFVGAGLPYFNPHSLRNTLVRLGQDLCKSPEEFKAWSQNLGHEKVLTTFTSYGAIARDRQGEILRSLATPRQPVQLGANQIVEALFEKFRDSGMDVHVK
jgi:integrase/recombinase XerC